MRIAFVFLCLGLSAITGCTPTDSVGRHGQDAGNHPSDDGSVAHLGNGGSGSGIGRKDGGPMHDASMMSNSDSGMMSLLDASGGGDGSADADATLPTGSVVDPAPEATTPGAYTCVGCPDAGVTQFQLSLDNVTSQPFTGVVTGAIGNGQFYLEGEAGQSIGGVIPTDTNGNYSFTLPLFCGTQLLKCLWSNDAGKYVAVVQIVTTNCVNADIRVTLTWDNLGLDYELHLIKQGGQINNAATDCTWTSCIGQGPDWGVVGDVTDDPRKDVDNTGNYGPENIFYAGPEDGTYTVMVEHWGAGTPESDGQVTINVLGVGPTTIDITNLTSHHVFTAATIDWPSKVVTPVSADYDCSATWAGGCTAVIP